MPSIVLTILAIIFIAASLKVVKEYQRMALFRLGRYLGFKGPGLIIMIPVIDKCIPIAVEDQGILISTGIGKFKDSEVPVEYNQNIYIGSKIKVSGFSNQKIQVAPDSDQRRVIKCEKCGHEMRY